MSVVRQSTCVLETYERGAPAPTECMADVIRAAVTDGTHQLRYRVGGADAEMILTRQNAAG